MNSKSWPEGIPRKKVGTKTAKATTAIVSRRCRKEGFVMEEQRVLRALRHGEVAYNRSKWANRLTWDSPLSCLRNLTTNSLH